MRGRRDEELGKAERLDETALKGSMESSRSEQEAGGGPEEA